jgi:hypothetical protein
MTPRSKKACHQNPSGVKNSEPEIEEETKLMADQKPGQRPSKLNLLKMSSRKAAERLILDLKKTKVKIFPKKNSGKNQPSPDSG